KMCRDLHAGPTFMNVKRVGLVLAIVHLLLFAGFLVWKKAVAAQDGQSELLWIIWIPIDFPWSLCVPLLSQLAGDELISPTQRGISGILYFLPHFVHGVIGTIWWYYIPRLLTLLFSHLKGLRTRRD